MNHAFHSAAALLVLSTTIVLSGATAAPQAPPSDAITCWAADGDAVDAIGGHDGTLVNGTTFVTGVFGSAFSFDGIDDEVTVPYAVDLGMSAAYSLSARVNVSANSGLYRVVASRGDSAVNDIEVYVQANTNRMIVAHNRSTASFDYQGFATPPFGSWFHLTVTYDGTTARVYYDGVSQTRVVGGALDGSAVLRAPLDTGRDWHIGRTTHPAFGGIGHFDGMLDDLALFSRALTVPEIVAIRDAGASLCADIDTDGDGLSDDDEINVYMTNPMVADTDGDGLLDGTEVLIAEGGGCPNPLVVDSDGDGLSDGDEVLVYLTDPCLIDTDADSIPDGIDPLPLDPGGTPNFIHLALRVECDNIAVFDLSLFDAKNNNARAGRRGAMCNKLNAAASAVNEGDFESALDSLESLLAKLDGAPSPKDWMVDSLERDELVEALTEMAVLLEYL